jgi:hypothetical protein
VCQDKVLNVASSNSSSSLSSYVFLMARASKVFPTIEPNISHNDDDFGNVVSSNKIGLKFIWFSGEDGNLRPCLVLEYFPGFVGIVPTDDPQV